MSNGYIGTQRIVTNPLTGKPEVREQKAPSTVLHASGYAASQSGKLSSSDRKKIGMQAASLNKQQELAGQVVSKSFPVFSSINAGGTDMFAPKAQQTIQSWGGVKPGDSVFWWDAETLGTAPEVKGRGTDVFHITELAFVETKVTKSMEMTEGKVHRLLIQPTQEVQDRLAKVIQKASGGIPLTDDEYRTANDLMLYGGNGASFESKNEGGRNISYVTKQNVGAKSPVRKGAAKSPFEQNQIEVMREGLSNLVHKGTKAQDAIDYMSTFLNNNKRGKLHMAGHNVVNFDVPAILQYLTGTVPSSSVSKEEKMRLNKSRLKLTETIKGANHLDTLNFVKTYLPAQLMVGVVDNPNLQLGNIYKAVEGMKLEDAHEAFKDVIANIKAYNGVARTINEKVGMKELLAGEVNAFGFAGFDKTPLKSGDGLFSIGGLSTSQTGQFDNVFQVGKNGFLEEKEGAYYKQTPVAKHAEYEFMGTSIQDFDTLDENGNPTTKRQAVVQLRNSGTGDVHVLARDTEEEVQQLVHKLFRPMEKIQYQKDALSEMHNKDMARRSYDRMFNGDNGVIEIERNLDMLKVHNDMSSKKEWGGKRSSKEYAQAVYDEFMNQYGTKYEYAKLNQVSNVINMAGRLNNEKDILADLADNVRHAYGTKATSVYEKRRAESTALRSAKSYLDEMFGKRTSMVKMPDGFNVVDLGGKSSRVLMDLRSQDTTLSGIKNYITNGFDSHRIKDVHLSVVKQRLGELMDTVQGKRGNTGQDGTGVLTNKQRLEIERGLNKLDNGDSVDLILKNLAYSIYQDDKARPQNLQRRGVELEDVDKGYLQTDADRQTYQSNKQSIVDRAIQEGNRHLQTETVTSRSLNQKDILRQVFEIHDNKVEEIVNATGFGKTKKNAIQTKKASQTISEMVNKFAEQGLASTFVYNNKTDALQLALTRFEDFGAIMNLTPNQIIEHAKTTMVTVPLTNEKGNVVTPGSGKISRIKVSNRENGGYEITTALEQAMSNLLKGAGFIKQSMDEGDYKKAQSIASSKVNNALERLSQNSKLANVNKEMRDIDNVRSAELRKVRHGTVDVSDFAQEWMEWYGGGIGAKDKTYDKDAIQSIKEKARSNYSSFFKEMGMDQTMEFSKTIDAFIQERFGVDTNVHSIKDTHVSSGLRGTSVDVRNYRAFGFFNTMSREQFIKTANYASLNEDNVVEQLRASGYTEEQIKQRLYRKVSTTDAEVAYHGQGVGGGREINFLNTKVARMGDAKLGEIMKQAGIMDAGMSVYDGVAIVSENIAAAMGKDIEKKKKLLDGTTITPEMHAKFEQLVQEGKAVKLPNGSYDIIDGNISISDVATKINAPGTANHGQYRIGQYTVGDIAKQEIIGATYYEDKTVGLWERITGEDGKEKWNINRGKSGVTVRGFDNETGELILNEHIIMRDGTKFLSDSGDRITAYVTTADKMEALNKAAGISGAEAILPTQNGKRSMDGAFVSEKFNLVMNEAFEMQQQKLKVSDIAKKQTLQEGMQAVAEMFGTAMKKHLNINDSDYTVTADGVLALSSSFGKDGTKTITQDGIVAFEKDVNKIFQKEFGKSLSFNNDTVSLGHTGLAVANTENWENAVGYVSDRSRGLVRFGEKEISAVQKRFDDYMELQSPNAGADGQVRKSRVSKWLAESVKETSLEQHGRDQKLYREGIIRTMLDVNEDSIVSHGNGVFRDGEIVIKTSGSVLDSSDLEGRNFVKKDGNHYQISMNAFNDIDNKITVGGISVLENTVLSPKDIEVSINGETREKFKGIYEKNNQSMLLELPEIIKGKTVEGQSHLRLIGKDISRIGLGEEQTEVLTTLQKLQSKIFMGIRDVQSMQTSMDPEIMNSQEAMDKHMEDINKKASRVASQIDEYNKEAAHIVTSSRKGSFYDMNSAKMDMSGRFKTQVINPVLEKELGYEHGTAYISEKRMLEMTSGAERQVLESLGISHEKLTVGDMQKKIVEIAGTEGLYGFNGRFPTIEQDTIQVSKYKVDKTVNDDVMRITAGTAATLSADFDGDFTNAVLRMYGEGGEIGKGLHKEMKEIWGVESQFIDSYWGAANKAVQNEINEKGSYYEQALKEGRTLTVGELMKDQGFVDSFHAKIGEFTNQESVVARVGKQRIGPLDNAREKLLRTSMATKSVINDLAFEGKSIEEITSIRKNASLHVDRVQEFGRRLSQDAISSKMTSDLELNKHAKKMLEAKGMVEGSEGYAEEFLEIKRRRPGQIDKAINDISAFVQNPTGKGQLDKFYQANDILGLFKDWEEGVAGTTEQKYSVTAMVDSIREMHSLNGGNRNWLRNDYANLAISDGIHGDANQTAAQKVGEMLASPTARRGYLGEGSMFDKLVGDSEQLSERIIFAQEEKRLLVEQNAMNLYTNKSEMVSSRDASKISDNVLTEVMEHRSGGFTSMQNAPSKMSGMKGGGVAFGALWAASALVRSGPTPESMAETQDSMQQAVAPPIVSQPTARVVQNNDGEYLNVKIRAKDAKGINQQDLAAIVQNEVSAMMNTQMNLNLNISDNSQKLDKEWLQGVVANSISNGYAY